MYDFGGWKFSWLIVRDIFWKIEYEKFTLFLFIFSSFQSLEERKKYNDELRSQLKLQAQIHADHLRDALAQKDLETQRLVNRSLSERVEAESNKYKLQLAAVVGRLRGLDTALKGKKLKNNFHPLNSFIFN